MATSDRSALIKVRAGVLSPASDKPPSEPPRPSRPAGRSVRREAPELADWESLLRPRSAFRIIPASVSADGTLQAEGQAFSVPAFAGDGAALIEAVACGSCTIGPGLEARCSGFFQERRPSLALALDDLGTVALFRLKDRVLASIRREAGRRSLRVGIEASPGDHDLSIDHQSTILALAGTGDADVTVTGRAMLSPAKSMTFIVALGRDLSEPSGHRCDRCPARDHCRYR